MDKKVKNFNNQDVSEALSLLQNVLEEEKNRIFNAGSDAMKRQDVETARGVLDFSNKLELFIVEVQKLKAQWSDLMKERDRSSESVRMIVAGNKDAFFRKPSALTPREILKYIEQFQADLIANRRVYLGYYKQRGIRAQRIAKCALKFALENGLVDIKEAMILSDKSTAFLFKGGGWSLLKLTDGKRQDYCDSYGHNRYCSMPPVKIGDRMFLISHELYNEKNNDSVTPLVFFLLKHGMTIEQIEELCI